jgi:hypothetical protein
LLIHAEAGPRSIVAFVLNSVDFKFKLERIVVKVDDFLGTR